MSGSSCYLSTVEDQYLDASNLNVRITLHERQRWVFNRPDPPSDIRIFERQLFPKLANLVSTNTSLSVAHF